MELIPSIDLDVTDRLFDDVNGCYGILHLKYRSADAKETIVSTSCLEAFLRHGVSACERQYSRDHPEAEKYRDALIKATEELTKLLVEANRKDDAESVARLCVATAKAALDAVSASNVHDDNWKRHDLEMAIHHYSRALRLLQAILQDEAEYEASLVEYIAALTAYIELPTETSHFNWNGVSVGVAFLNLRFEAQLNLAVLRMKIGKHAEAQNLAQTLVDSKASPLIRARAMILFAGSKMVQAKQEHASSSEDIETGPAWARAAEEVEPLVSRACVLFSGVLNEEIECRIWGAEQADWEELYECLNMHGHILHRLGREEEEANVAKKLEEFERWYDEESEDEDEEQGEEGDVVDDAGE